MTIIAGCRLVLCCGLMIGFAAVNRAHAETASDAECRAEIEKAERIEKDGPLGVYQLEDDKTLIAIKKEDFDKEFIFANYVDRGVAPFVGQYAEPRLIGFRLNGKKIDIIQKDSVGFFQKDAPLRRTRALTMSDGVIASLKLHKCQPDGEYFAYIDQGVLSKMSAEFLGLFHGARPQGAELKGWRSYSDNISFISEHRFAGHVMMHGRVSNPNFAIRIRHILLQRPAPGFAPRRNDPRIGYFGVWRMDLGDFSQTTPQTYIQKWRLDKKQPEAALSEPVKPIVFWIENTTPEKFRPYIKQGVLAWNEAFRSAGFVNAIEVREQPVDADWDAGDISKNVIRWQAAYHARADFGMAPSIYDPITGEILGADILLNFAGIGDYTDDWARLSQRGSFAQPNAPDPVALQRDDLQEASSPSKILNTAPAKEDAPTQSLEGSYMLAALLAQARDGRQGPIPAMDPTKIQSQWNGAAPAPLAQKTAAAEPLEIPTISAPALGYAERMVKEVIIQLTMHEVGHTLGLSHNFRGSHWRSVEEIFDREKTKGMISASVMDYLPINFSPVGAEQGDFANTRLGPYDIWAIEFGYRPDFDAAQRNEFLKLSTKPEHQFNLEFAGNEPQTLLRDLTSNPLEYAKSRLNFASEASKLAAANLAFESQEQYISLFQELTGQIHIAVDTITAQVAPFTTDFSQLDRAASNPFEVVSLHSKAEQKQAVKTLEELVFSEDALPISDEFIARLGRSRHAAAVLRKSAQRSVMSRLMSQRSLVLRDRAGKHGGKYSSTELLFDLKRAVFGSDLSPLARPGRDRREQQLMFASYLAALISDNSSNSNARLPRGNIDRSITSAAARPVREALLRELMTPIPWASAEVRAHRQELRAILQ